MHCSLSNGVLTFSDNHMSVKEIFSIFRKDLLSKQIPNYRPVGIVVHGAKSSDMIQVVRDISMSYLEAGFLINNLVLADRVGKKNSQFSMSVFEDSYSFITYMKSKQDDYGEYVITGGGMKRANTLLSNTELFGGYISSGSSFAADVVLKKGVGERTFDDNYSLFNVSVGTFYPTTTDYSLFDFFRILPYKSEECLKLTYTVDLNEEVLSKILSDYFGGTKFNVESQTE